MVAELPPGVKVTFGLEESAVRGMASNSSSSKRSSMILTLVHCRKGGGPMELPEGKWRVFETAMKSMSAVHGEEKKRKEKKNNYLQLFA